MPGPAFALLLAPPESGAFRYLLFTPLAMNPLLMIPLLTATGLASFWLFYKSVDFFDNI